MARFKILKYAKIVSTQAKALSLRKSGTVVVAEEQTGGKGRFRRKWSSGKGGLYFSVSVVMRKVDEAPILSLVAGLAGRQAIRNVCGIRAELKWPNDIMVDGKKVGGILSESFSLRNERLAVVGVGINTNNRIPVWLRSKASSLCSVNGKKINNDVLLDAFLVAFSRMADKISKGKLQGVVSSYRKSCSTIGGRVKVRVGCGVVAGVAVGVTSRGYLQVKHGGDTMVVVDGTVMG